MPDEVIDGGPIAPEAPPAPESVESSTNTTQGELAQRFLSRAKPAPEQPAEPELPPEVDEVDTGEPVAVENAAEEPEETAPETEVEETPAEEEEVLLQPDDPKGVKKRIGKALEKQRAAEAKAEEERQAREALEARIAELEAKPAEQPRQPEPAPVPIADDDPGNRAASAATAEDLAKIRTEAEQALEWAELNADGVMDAEGNVKFTAAEVRQIKVGAQRHLNRYIPQREQFMARQAQATAAARDLWPEMFDTKSEMYHQAQAAIKQRPYLARDPDAMLIAGLTLEGYKAVQARKAAAAAPVQTVKPAKPKPPPAPAREVPAMTRPMTPTVNKVLKDKLTKAEATYSSTGRAADYQEVLRLRKQLGNTQ